MVPLWGTVPTRPPGGHQGQTLKPETAQSGINVLSKRQRRRKEEHPAQLGDVRRGSVSPAPRTGGCAPNFGKAAAKKGDSTPTACSCPSTSAEDARRLALSGGRREGYDNHCPRNSAEVPSVPLRSSWESCASAKVPCAPSGGNGESCGSAEVPCSPSHGVWEGCDDKGVWTVFAYIQQGELRGIALSKGARWCNIRCSIKPSHLPPRSYSEDYDGDLHAATTHLEEATGRRGNSPARAAGSSPPTLQPLQDSADNNHISIHDNIVTQDNDQHRQKREFPYATGEELKSSNCRKQPTLQQQEQRTQHQPEGSRITHHRQRGSRAGRRARNRRYQKTAVQRRSCSDERPTIVQEEDAPSGSSEQPTKGSTSVQHCKVIHAYRARCNQWMPRPPQALKTSAAMGVTRSQRLPLLR